MPVAELFHARYRIDRRLGGGTHGEVHRAWDASLNREVALKRLQPGTPFAWALDEGRTVVSLRSEHIVGVYDVGVDYDVPFLTMPVMALGTLNDRLPPHGFAADGTLVRWVRQMLVGLQVVHNQRLLHRDVKPGNVFLESETLARLGDLGLAAQEDLTGTAESSGDPDILAPEGWTTGRVSRSSDIWSVGATMFCLLTGHFPRAAAQAAGRDTVRLGDIAPHVHTRIRTWVEKAMAPDPNDRYRTAGEMDRALGNPPHCRRWVKRAPHEGHRDCWIGDAFTGRGPLDLCVWQEGSRLIYEARHAEGGSRVVSACGKVPNESRLAVELRRTFSRL